VVNLDQKTVSGLWEASDDAKSAVVYTPLPITATDANSVRFEARKEEPGEQASITGTVDRITGMLWAREQKIYPFGGGHREERIYDLRCKPMKPLF
jgi:hypothetical protein